MLAGDTVIIPIPSRWENKEKNEDGHKAYLYIFMLEQKTLGESVSNSARDSRGGSLVVGAAWTPLSHPAVRGGEEEGEVATFATKFWKGVGCGLGKD